MAEIIDLKTEKRERLGSANSRRLRASGAIPAVLYGKKQDLLHLTVDKETLVNALNHQARVFQLGLPDGQSASALIKDLQIDHLTDAVLHIDFERVGLDEKIEVEPKVKVVGVPKGAAEGGTLEVGIGSIRVLCAVRDLADAFRIDASNLGISESIEAKDLPLPPGATLVTAPDALIARCNPPAVLVVSEGEGEGEAAAAAS